MAITVQDAACPGDGAVQVTLSGSEIDVSRVVIELQPETGPRVLSSVNGFKFLALPAGNYTVTATADCKVGQTSSSQSSGVRVEDKYPEMNIEPLGATTSYKCLPTGSTSVRITGGKPPYSVRMDSKPAEYTGPTVFTQSTPGDLRIPDLYPGAYSFTITDNCGSGKPYASSVWQYFPSFSIPGNGIIPAMKECVNLLGSVSFNMANGKTPYTITITSKPSAYTGAVQFTSTSHGSMRISNLEPGIYDFTVADSCQDSQSFTGIVIEEFRNEFPRISDKASPEELDCDKARINIMNLTTNGLEAYLRQYVGSCFYDISYTIDGVYTDWRNACSSPASVIFNLPSSYRSLYNGGKTIEINLRLSGSTAPECVKTYEIPFTKPSDVINYNIKHDFDSCNYRLVNFSVNYMALCTSSVFYELKDDFGVLMFQGTGTEIDEPLEYDEKYWLTIGDSETRLDTFVYRKKPVPELFPDDSTKIDRYCDYYHWTFRVDSVCPYTYEVYKNDMLGLPFIKEEESKAGERYEVTELEYDSVYVFYAYNSDWDTIYVIQNRFKDIHDISAYGDLDFQCEDYMFRFEVGSNVQDCLYTWEIWDSGGNKVDSGDFLSINTQKNVFPKPLPHPVSSRFDYGEEYTIKVFNSKDSVIIIEKHKLDKETYYTPLVFNGVTRDNINCDDLSYNGYIELSGPLYNGTRIRFIRGPVGSPPPAHTDVTLTDYDDYNKHFRTYDAPFPLHPNNTLYSECTFFLRRCDEYRNDLNRFNQFYNQNPAYNYLDFYDYYPYYYTYHYNYTVSFFPFSQDYHNGEVIPLDDGEYTFQITDHCGNDTTITIRYRKKRLVTEDFIIRETQENATCGDEGGIRVFPAGNVLDNGVSLRPQFRLVDSPDGIVNIPLTGNYFLFKKTGIYVMERSYEGCIIDSLSFDYVRKPLTGVRSLAYTCGQTQSIQIQVEGKNGIAPYRYTLCDEAEQDLGQSNGTGIFVWNGPVDAKYKIRITDFCGISVSVPVDLVILDQIPLIERVPALCAGETIQLSSYLLGATSYTWRKEGEALPLANKAQLTITNATVEHTGNYIMDIQPLGCTNIFSDTVSVEVYPLPRVPQMLDSVFLCRSDMIYQFPVITPQEGCIIKWYDRSNELITTGFGEVNREENIFFVEQVNTHGCSNRKRVVVSKSSMARKQLFETICEGEIGPLFKGIHRNIAGIYRDTIWTGDCDTAVVLNLKVNPFSTRDMVTVNGNPICRNSEAKLTATATTVINPEFKWYAEDNTNFLLSERNSFTTPPLTSNTTYYVSVWGDNYCEGDRKPVQVPVQDSSRISIKPDKQNFCQDGKQEIILTAKVESGKPSAIVWYDGEETEILSDGQSSKTPVIPSDEESVYRAYAIDDVCGDSEEASATVYLTFKIDLTLSANAQKIPMWDSVTLTVTGGDPGNYRWYDASTRELIATTPSETLVYSLDNEGRYSFYVQTENAPFCPDAESNVEYVLAESVIPNIITPYDGNGKNDTFMKAKDGRPGYKVEIYNRYRQKVFEGDDGWDGTYRGKLADPGTYFYRLVKDGKVYRGTIDVVKF